MVAEADFGRPFMRLHELETVPDQFDGAKVTEHHHGDDHGTEGGQQGEGTDDKAEIARDQRHEQRGQQRQTKNAGQRRKGRVWVGRRGRQQRQTEYVGEGWHAQERNIKYSASAMPAAASKA